MPQALRKTRRRAAVPEVSGVNSRARILRKAREKFSTLGYAKTSMAEIAAELGMSKKTLYKFFATKRILAEAMVEEVFALFNREFDAILAARLPAIEKLHRIVRFLIEQQQRFVTRAMLESMYLHLPELWRRVEKFRRARMQKNMQIILAQALREGAVLETVNFDMFVHFLLGAVQEGLSAQVLVHASYSMHEATQGLIDLFLNGILTPAGRRQYRRLYTGAPAALQRPS